MFFEHSENAGLDYYPCRYGGSKTLFRGPKKRLKGRHVVFLGGSETYGKYIERPFPERIEAALGVTCVNLGCVNAGIDVFLHDPEIMTIAARADAVVVQATGAQNLSNRLYTVHPRRNDRFLKASDLLQTIFREVDFTEFHFTRHMLSTLKLVSMEKFSLVEAELRRAWVARMKLMLETLGNQTVLLWLAEHPAEAPEEADDLGPEPLLLTEAMLTEAATKARHRVDCVVAPPLPERRTIGMAVPPLDEPKARAMLPATAHAEAAEMLAPVLKGILDQMKTGPAKTDGPR